jgi:hypothetical protein
MMSKIKRPVENLRTPQDVSAFALRLAEAVCVRYELQLRALKGSSGGAARVVDYMLAQLNELLLDPNDVAETSPDMEQLHTLLLRRLETRGERERSRSGVCARRRLSVFPRTRWRRLRRCRSSIVRLCS